MKLKEKVATITGSSSGMGRATAVLFAQEGAKVVVVGHNELLKVAAAGCPFKGFINRVSFKHQSVKNLLRNQERASEP
ncbi:MAG TPA: SDR family NAD(P)-dependent oxidoreductase [Methanobacterium sp.]